MDGPKSFTYKLELESSLSVEPIYLFSLCKYGNTEMVLDSEITFLRMIQFIFESQIEDLAFIFMIVR